MIEYDNKINVFVGAETSFSYGIRIGEKVIVGTNFVIIKNLEPNCVYLGIPVRKIGTFEDFAERGNNGKHLIIKHIMQREIDDA